ncbi:hypothetical protein [Colwellia psychrerythraea]|uniref:PEP-CTERM protein-sorting domain-containing protein n=1 Tax=Colwellia psychrerythraea TaxID=28229 RepID=A0A099KPZ2_COLPS|nr:hypothetical protein [Colwellia psychrerythraea]KGJ91688.1 hypothetical protein GAB14E_3170 [Colwellia psychrerythraea]
MNKLNRKIFSLIISLSVTLAAITSANAGIITEEWSAILTSADRNNLPEGELYTWQVTYDDSATVAYVSSDGVDQLYNTADDFIITSINASSRYPIYGNIIDSTIGSVIDELRRDIASSLAPSDELSFWNKNNSHHNSSYSKGNSRNVEWSIDDADFRMVHDSFDYASFNYYYALNGVNKYSTLFFNNLTLNSVSQIPEPTSAIILLTALAGLARQRYYKK